MCDLGFVVRGVEFEAFCIRMLDPRIQFLLLFRSEGLLEPTHLETLLELGGLNA